MLKQTIRMRYIYSVFFIIFAISSCTNKNNSNDIELVKTGYYPPFVQHFEIIANLESKSLVFYNPSKYLIAPPPPPEKNSSSEEIEKLKIEYEHFVNDNPKIEPEYIDLNNKEIYSIQKIINSFSADDFEEDEKKNPVTDGANTNTVIVLKNRKVYSIGGYEGTNRDKEIELSSKLFSIYKQKGTSKINKKFIKKLEKRHN